MASYYFSPLGNSQQLSTTGAPLTAGTITTFQAGTSTPQATYTDNAGSNPATSLTLNTYGLPSSPVWLLGGQAYKFVIKDSLGNTIRTLDNVMGINDPSRYAINIPSDGTFSFRNRLHNGNFVINQRAVSGTVTLAAGVYGHDRWKAGAGGCTYTFATVGNSSVITVSAGSLLQIVEANNIEGGVYTLVNQGTAQARYAVNGGTTSGGYFTASSAVPLALSTATANQQITIEFTTGTIDRVQLEAGTVATTFERRPYSVELALCQRYLPAWTVGDTVNDRLATGFSISTASALIFLVFPVTPRVALTGIAFSALGDFKVENGQGTSQVATGITFNASGRAQMSIVVATAAVFVAGQGADLSGGVVGSGKFIYATGAEL